MADERQRNAIVEVLRLRIASRFPLARDGVIFFSPFVPVRLQKDTQGEGEG